MSYESYIAAKEKAIDGVKCSLIGNCKRLIFILENTPTSELARKGAFRTRAEIRNKLTEIRRDAITLREEIK